MIHRPSLKWERRESGDLRHHPSELLRRLSLERKVEMVSGTVGGANLRPQKETGLWGFDLKCD